MRTTTLPAVCRLALTFFVAATALPAAEHWIRVASPHFEMFTTNSAKRAAHALETFEQVRYFFLKASQNQHSPEGLVRIIAFSSEKEYKPYRMNSGAFAYYLQSRERDYIVMQDIESVHSQAAVHEYTHLIVQHAKLEWPLWFNEGFADLYSSLEPRGKKAMVGRAIPDRLLFLLSQPWMNWNVLFNVDHSSPYYNESDKMSVFYAQSWMLTHMLALSPDYIDKFPAFMAAISDGSSTPDAFQKVYGKSVAEVAKDVSNYARRATIQAMIFDVTLPSSDLETQSSDLPPFQVDLALADLLASRKETQAEARTRLLALSSQNPQSADVEESLGYLAWQSADVPEARKHFALAAERGSKNVRMLYNAAMLDQVGNQSDAAVALLHKVIELEPDHTDARILLAEVEASRHHLSEALKAITFVHAVKPDQAYRFFAIAAYTHASLNNLDNAHQFAEKAVPYAKTPDQKMRIDQLIASIDSARRVGKPSKPTAVAAAPRPSLPPDPAQPQQPDDPDAPQHHVRLARNGGLPQATGTTKTFECVKSGGYRLHIQTREREMIFAMPDPKAVIIRNVPEVLWNCGTLPPREVTVIYKAGTSTSSDGTVSELVFTPQ